MILETVLPGLSGLDVIRTLRAELPQARWLIFSSTVHRESVRRVLLDNPHGFVHKRDDLADFHEALRAVARGRSYFTPFAMQCRGGTGASLCPAAVLTEREREVLRMIAEGKTSKEMADLLIVACRTVEHHRSNLMDKLKIHDIARLTRFAVRVGLVSAEF